MDTQKESVKRKSFDVSVDFHADTGEEYFPLKGNAGVALVLQSNGTDDDTNAHMDVHYAAYDSEMACLVKELLNMVYERYPDGVWQIGINDFLVQNNLLTEDKDGRPIARILFKTEKDNG